MDVDDIITFIFDLDSLEEILDIKLVNSKFITHNVHSTSRELLSLMVSQKNFLTGYCQLGSFKKLAQLVRFEAAYVLENFKRCV